VATNLDLKPKAELMAQAQAAGLSLAQFLSRELEAIVRPRPLGCLPPSLTSRINGRRNSTNGSTASLSIPFCMRKRSNARTGIPTGSNAGEDEDSPGLPVT